MPNTDGTNDLWRQGYRPISATLYLTGKTSDEVCDPVKIEEFDLAPDFPVLRAILRSWLANGNPPIDHVEVTEREDVDRDILAANSISFMLH